MQTEQRNNLFTYAPKELSTDAFLCWLFNECSSNPEMKTNSLQVFQKICLTSDDREVVDVQCELQLMSTDLIVTFRRGDSQYKVLFENKTRSSIQIN